MHAKLHECVIILDDVVDDEGELVYYVFYVDIERVNVAEAVKDSRWMEVMMDEVKPIKDNDT